jgi:hypothetical protein
VVHWATPQAEHIDDPRYQSKRSTRNITFAAWFKSLVPKVTIVMVFESYTFKVFSFFEFKKERKTVTIVTSVNTEFIGNGAALRGKSSHPFYGGAQEITWS